MWFLTCIILAYDLKKAASFEATSKSRRVFLPTAGEDLGPFVSWSESSPRFRCDFVRCTDVILLEVVINEDDGYSIRGRF